MRYTTEFPLLQFIITNIIGYTELKPLGESDTINEVDLVGLIICLVTVS